MILAWPDGGPYLDFEQVHPTTWIIVGVLLAITTQVIVTGFWRFISKTFNLSGNKNNDSDAIYGLDHGKLNISLPPQSMWMNMGFWRDVDKDDFPGACRALLYILLDQAGLLEPETHGKPRQIRNDINMLSILDVGFGCGDQTLCLADLVTPSTTLTYLGITLNHTQHKLAQQRLSSSPYQNNPNNIMNLFHGNAASPQTWSPSCAEKSSSLSSSSSSSSSSPPQSSISSVPTILLALDTLYHFSPSRLPLLAHAQKTLHLDLLAFDILLSDTATPLQTLQLRLLGLLSGCPWNAFLTEAEYRRLLLAAGYEDKNGDENGSIVITDITEHVFGPLSGFMQRQKTRLETVGLKMGKLSVAGWLFGWWARSGVVRGVLITAKAKREWDG